MREEAHSDESPDRGPTSGKGPCNPRLAIFLKESKCETEEEEAGVRRKGVQTDNTCGIADDAPENARGCSLKVSATNKVAGRRGPQTRSVLVTDNTKGL